MFAPAPSHAPRAGFRPSHAIHAVERLIGQVIVIDVIDRSILGHNGLHVGSHELKAPVLPRTEVGPGPGKSARAMTYLTDRPMPARL